MRDIDEICKDIELCASGKNCHECGKRWSKKEKGIAECTSELME